MTNDRQTQAVAEAYTDYCVKRTCCPEPENTHKEMFDAGWKAAIAASDAKYVPMLVEALRYALWQHHGGGSPENNHWACVLANTLSQLPEDLR